MRLALTTTPDRIGPLEESAARFGFDPVPLPCIRIDTVDGGPDRVAAAAVDADLLVLTSARSVAILGPDGLRDLPIVAVGAATATAATDAGGTVVWSGTGGVRRLAVDAAEVLAGKRVVLAGATNNARENAAAIEMAGATPLTVELYTTVPVAPGDDEVDAVVFGSPSAVTGWHISRDLTDLLVGAVGPTTAAALLTHGVEADAVPDTPGFTNTIELLAALRPERSTP